MALLLYYSIASSVIISCCTLNLFSTPLVIKEVARRESPSLPKRSNFSLVFELVFLAIMFLLETHGCARFIALLSLATGVAEARAGKGLN
jgi:hypothetical protein